MPFKTYIPSKSDRARAIAIQLKADGKTVTPKRVCELLARQGVTMSPGHCARATEKFRTKRRYVRRAPGRRREVSVQPMMIVRDVPVTAETATAAAPAIQRMDCASLIYAAQLIKSCGGVEKARKTLTEAALIVDPFTQP